MGKNKVGVDTNKHKNEIISVGKIAAKVAGVRNGLDTKTDHLKVDKIHTIFKIYDDLTKLVSSYGEMAAHDLKEFRQLGINIENTDAEGGKTMSNTELYYAQLTDLSVRIAAGIKNRRDPLDELTQALEQLSQTNAIKGNAADAMKAYISEVHMTLIQTLQLILFNYQAALGKYVTGYLEVDSDENFKLIEEDFDAHEHNLSSHRSDFTSIGKKLKAISDEAEDIVSLSGAGSKRLFNVADEMDDMKRTVSDLKEKWNSYEDKEQGFDDVQDLIAQTTSLLKNTLSVPHGYSYSPGSFSKLMSKNFVDAFEVNADYAQKPDTQKAFKANWNRICKNYKVDQKRMAEEKAKEEAEKEGRRALIWDELQIAAGAVLVVTGAGTGFGVLLIAGGVNGYINHTSMALTGNSFNIAGSLTNGAAQWYNKNIGEPLVKTGNPIAKVAAGLGNSVIQTAGGMGQFNVYDIGKAGYTLYTNPQAKAQFKAGLKNYWNKLRSGDAYTIGQTAGVVASVLVNPGDISAAAGKASKAESLLGKVGIFSKSIAISSAENAKNIVTSPFRTINNLRNKAADLRTLFSDGKGVAGDFTKSVVVSDAKNANSVLTKVKGKLKDVGTVSGAFAKAFGKTYKVEMGKYANTVFGGFGGVVTDAKVLGKSIVAGGKEAKSALNFAKGAGNAEIKLGKADLDEFRTEIGVPERDTIAIGKTDVRGLEGYKFKGASPQVRADAKLDSLDNIYPNRSIRAPYNKTIRGQGQFVEHAEEDVIAQFEDAVSKTGLKSGEVEGTLYIHQSNPDGVCNKCTVDLFKPSKNGKKGIFKQLTEKYPNLTIKVSTEIDPAIEFPANTLSFELKNGKVIDAIQIRKNPTNPFQFKEYPK